MCGVWLYIVSKMLTPVHWCSLCFFRIATWVCQSCATPDCKVLVERAWSCFNSLSNYDMEAFATGCFQHFQESIFSNQIWNEQLHLLKTREGDCLIYKRRQIFCSQDCDIWINILFGDSENSSCPSIGWTCRQCYGRYLGLKITPAELQWKILKGR
jgi:hypothetical protein